MSSIAVTNADSPRIALEVVARGEDVPASIDNETERAVEFTGGEIDGEALRNRSEIEHERAPKPN